MGVVTWPFSTRRLRILTNACEYSPNSPIDAGALAENGRVVADVRLDMPKALLRHAQRRVQRVGTTGRRRLNRCRSRLVLSHCGTRNPCRQHGRQEPNPVHQTPHGITDFHIAAPPWTFLPLTCYCTRLRLHRLASAAATRHCCNAAKRPEPSQRSSWSAGDISDVMISDQRRFCAGLLGGACQLRPE